MTYWPCESQSFDLRGGVKQARLLFILGVGLNNHVHLLWNLVMYRHKKKIAGLPQIQILTLSLWNLTSPNLACTRYTALQEN